MARYIDAVCKLCRREGVKLFLKGDKCYTKCILERRPSAPGNAKPQRSKPSDFAIRLREKQKLRRMISMNETSFARLVDRAARSRVSTGDQLLRSVELRLDNIARRMGFATSLKAARQLVLHGHIKVSGKTVTIPSYPVKEGDVVALDSRLRENVPVKVSIERAQKQNTRPSFLEFNEETLSGKVLRQPDRTESSFPVTDQLIIEYYSR